MCLAIFDFSDRKSSGFYRKALVLFFAGLFLFHPLLYAETTEQGITEQSTTDFTIETAILAAFANNRFIKMHMADVEKASANKLYAISNFLPKVEMEYDFTAYQDTAYDAMFSQRPLPSTKKDPRTFFGYKSDNFLGLGIEQDIFKGGAHIANFKQSELELLSQWETYRAVTLEIEYETKRLFYGLLLAYEVERIARDLVIQAEAHYEETLAKYNQGTTSKFDVLQSKVHVALVIPQLIIAENSIELLMIEFKKLLALDLDEDIAINGTLAFIPIAIREKNFLVEAYVRRPEMILKTLGVSIEKWGVELAKATGIPRLSGNFDYYGRSNNIATMLSHRHDTWYIGVKATLPIFDGLATPAKINEARAQYLHAQLNKRDYEDELAVDIKRICLDLKQWSAIIYAQKDSIIEAREALRLSEVRYDTGVGINLDVLDCQVALAQVEQSLAEAKYDYIMAKADLNKAMGRELSKEE